MSRQTKLAVCVRRSMAQRLLFQCLVVVTSAALVGGSFAVIEAAPSAVQASDGTSSDTAADAANTGLESIQSSPGVTSGPVPEVSATLVETNTWPMAGANPQRTSWSPEQVPSVAYMAANRQTWNNGMLYPQWAKPIQPYISHKVQVIAANSTLYISTARGLYALNSDTGAVRWVYPTELPLGNAPTIYGNVAYVGGLDKKIHAINALTGEGLWTFEATQGFETNPLVVNGILYAGNRDGALYAIDVNTHQLAWKYQTGGPILFSAAYTTTASYPGGVVYFASNDNYAYAVNAQTSALVWQSAKLPSAGFQSWWPVVYGNVVVFVGASSYRDVVRPGPTCQCNIDALDRDGVFPNAGSAPKGTPVGARINGGEWLDATAIRTYLQNYPQRRTYFVLNRDSGSEGTPYAPILWFGTQSGTRYPPLVGSDGNLYQTNDFLSAPTVNGGGISGWQYGTTNISQPAVTWFAIDEPLAYSAGGNIIYWSLSGNQAAGAFDISVPNTRFWSGGNQPLVDAYREWAYWSYDLNTRLPDYDVAYGGTQEFGGINGIYDRSDQNAPIPYKGKVYLIQGNAVIALGMTNPSPSILPMAATVPVAETTAAVDQNLLRQKLAAEVQKMITAGHLRPGYLNSGLVNIQMVHDCSDNFQDYWHDPSDTLYALLLALPYLPSALQQSTRTYLQSELANYPPYTFDHIGWQVGAAREAFPLPPEVEADRANLPKSGYASWDFEGWGGGKVNGGTNFPPHMFYALWKYAQAFPGTAQAIFNASKTQLSAEPGDAVLAKYPFVHNSFIAGYEGYLNLQKLAGYSEDAAIRAKLNRLLALRASNFSKDNTFYPHPPSGWSYCLGLSVSRNFLFLVPELGDYLRANALSKVQQAVDEYSRIEPYWFVAGYQDTIGEGEIQPLYDLNALFQAKALILKEPANKLVKYLDVPAFAVGDLFYIQNLVTLLEPQNMQNIEITASRSGARQGDVVRYALTVGAPFTPTLPITVTSTWSSGLQYNGGLCQATAGTPVCSATIASWSGAMPGNGLLVITYTTQVVTSLTGLATSQLQVDGGSQGIYTRTHTLVVNPFQVSLPQVRK